MFDGVFSRDNLLRIKDGAYAINIDDNQSKGTTLGFIIYGQNYGCALWFFIIEYISQDVFIKNKRQINQL